MQKTVAGSTTGYLYGGANIVQEQGSGASNLATGFGYDQFYARTDGSGTQVPLSDSLQSTVGMTDAAGGLGAQYTYEPYGSTAVAGSGGGSQQFTGRENDGTGLMYYRARYYAPGMGRFASEDPLGFGGGDVNLYLYVHADVINMRDPLGEMGIGIEFGVNAQTGLGVGVASSASFGLMYFADTGSGGGTGSFDLPAGVGATTYAAHGLSLPALTNGLGAGQTNCSIFNPWALTPDGTVFGAGGGYGVGLSITSITNADSVNDLAGEFNTVALNTPLFSMQIGLGTVANGRTIWQVTFSFGPSVGSPIMASLMRTSTQPLGSVWNHSFR